MVTTRSDDAATPPSPLRNDEIDAAISLWERAQLTRPWNDARADARRALAAPCATILAARRAGALVGTVMVGHDGHRGWVYYLAVEPSWQKQSIGAQLMTAAEAWLRPHVPKMQVMVRGDNIVAKGFYERLGYAVSDVVVLQRTLGEPPA